MEEVHVAHRVMANEWSNRPLALDDRLVARALSLLLTCAVFFPYVQVIPLKTDTQPYALAFSVLVVLAARNRRMPAAIALLLVVLVWALPVGAMGQMDFTLVRSLANYLSVFFIALAAYIDFKCTGGLSGRAFRVIVWIWFAVGLVQTFIYPDFLVFITPRAIGTAGSGGRGVVGLSPEATHYGLYCIFLLLLDGVMERMGRITRRERNVLALVLLVQIIVFARSSMAVLLLMLWGALYVVVYMFSARRLLASLLCAALLAGVVVWMLNHDVQALEGSRLYRLAQRLVRDPMLLLLVDGSVNDRLFHIIFSFTGAVESFGLPHGFTAWADHVQHMMPRYSPYAWNVSTTRIMSGYGSAVFELGAVGFLIPLSVTLALRRFFKPDLRAFLVVTMFLNLVMLTSVPIAFPLFGYTIGMLAYGARRQNSDAVVSAAGLH